MPHTVTPRNRLLLALPQAERDRLMPLLEAVDLSLLQVLHEAGEPMRHAYFVEEGVVSEIVMLEGGQEIEVGLVGPEGMVGFPLALGVERSHTESMVQVPGRALRLSAARLREELARKGPLDDILLVFVHHMFVQTSQVAACNVRHALSERLARWLLMLHDRIGADRMPATHEFVSILLGVRRSGVSVALGVLERAGAITQERGCVRVENRGLLEQASCECYAAVRDSVS